MAKHQPAPADGALLGANGERHDHCDRPGCAHRADCHVCGAIIHQPAPGAAWTHDLPLFDDLVALAESGQPCGYAGARRRADAHYLTLIEGGAELYWCPDRGGSCIAADDLLGNERTRRAVRATAAMRARAGR